MSNDPDFRNKVAIVTGASRGIGRVICLGLAKRGCAVVGNARHLDSSPGSGGTLKETIQLAESFGVEAIAIPGEITHPDGVDALVKRTLGELGRVDILINNAGVYPYGEISEFEPSEWKDVMEVNLTAPFLMCRAVVPHMIQIGSGNIINVSSGAAHKMTTGRVAYAASKWALNRFTFNLAEEVKQYGVAVNAWSPGVIRTDMNRYRDGADEPSIVEESAVWLAAQGIDFTGHEVNRAEFGVVWGPGC